VWTIAFVLFGLVVLGALAGSHIGSSAHALAGTAGFVTAIGLVAMTSPGTRDGRFGPCSVSRS
jgi:hypothetical protein